jgi:adenosylhomocysteine nucleosidase
MAQVAILSAVMLEARAIAKSILAGVPRPGEPSESEFEGIRIIHHLVGIGAVGLVDIQIDPQTDYIIMAGVAGALDPSLALGDVILGDCPEAIAGPVRIRRGTIHTTDRIVSTPAEKAELFNQTSASVVDMETAPVRAFALRLQIPFIALRAISDTSSQQLDSRLLKLVDPWGRPKPTALAKYLAANPIRIGALMKLGRDSGLAVARVGEGVREVLRGIGRGASEQ